MMSQRPNTTVRPLLLVILDGFGVNAGKMNNAIAEAQTPRLDEYFFRYPSTLLSASSTSVGLPSGQMGNSEVGHMTIGSGCVVRQDLVLIDEAIANGSFFTNPVLNRAIDKAAAGDRPLHLFGLVSDGGVHSHLQHLLALIALCERKRVRPLVHVVTDGRDTPPKSALRYLPQLEQSLAQAGGSIATLCGRYYAMDRDRRWERVERAWRAMVLGKGRRSVSASAALDAAYSAGETDEFVQPTILPGYAGMAQDDVFIAFNFRKDRPRQTVAALASADFAGFDRGASPLADVTCMMEYDPALGLPFAYEPQVPAITLNQILSEAGLRQLHCAETEKYAHVTSFFNGGCPEPLAGEDHILIPSPKVATYDLKPAMSAPKVADTLVAALGSEQYDFIVANFANGDMVGHTGVRHAVIEAVEVLDREVGKVLDAAVANGYTAVVSADHGNCDLMVDPVTDEPHTQHTTNPVPCLIVDDRHWLLAQFGGLADIAPTLLRLMGLEQPLEMQGRSLLVRELDQPALPTLANLNAA